MTPKVAYVHMAIWLVEGTCLPTLPLNHIILVVVSVDFYFCGHSRRLATTYSNYKSSNYFLQAKM